MTAELEPIKIIFLDIDGVLNSLQSHFYYNSFLLPNEDSWVDYRHAPEGEFTHNELQLCPIACSNLKLVLDLYPKTRIVISSTWRKSRPFERFNKLFNHYKIFTGDKVIGSTPILNTIRGYEIKQWMDDYFSLKEKHPKIEDFIILDDDSDMEPYTDTAHFIQTSSKTGFDYKAFERVDQKFGNFNLRFEDLKPETAYRMYSKPRESYFYREGKEMVYHNSESRRVSCFFYKESELFSKVM